MIVELLDPYTSKYSYLQTVCKVCREHQYSKIIENYKTLVLTAIEKHYFTPKMQAYFKSVNPTGEPFTNYEEEPEQIGQIKKFVNALYYAELALKDFETVNLEDGDHKLQDLSKLYYKTSQYIFQASYLITHIDVDLFDMFAKEWEIISPVFKLFHSHAENIKEDTKNFLLKLPNFQVPHSVGKVSGIIVDQMKPHSGKIDYEFLTQFTAVIPGYLEKFSKKISEFSEKVKEQEPNLDRKTLAELQEHAFQLINSIDKLNGGDLYLTVRLLHYIYIVRHALTLSMSIIEQLGNLSDSTQDAIHTKLAEFKYKVLPEIFDSIDNLEVQFMLKPGTIAQPVMEGFRQVYASLTEYTGKMVNFASKGEQHKTIEDVEFLSYRLERTYQRIAANKKKLVSIEEAQKAATSFFRILKEQQNTHTRLVDVSVEIKKQLAFYYHYLHPYMAQMDMDLDHTILDSLSREKGVIEAIGKPLHWLPYMDYTDDIGFILGKGRKIETEKELNILFSRQRETIKFNEEINNEVISTIQQDAEVHLHPWTNKTNAFTVDASTITKNEFLLTIFNLMDGKGEAPVLSDTQASQVNSLYREKRQELLEAHTALKLFCEILNNEVHQSESSEQLLTKLDKEKKDNLYRLYRQFRYYLVRANMEGNISLDHTLEDCLQPDPTKEFGLRQGEETEISIKGILQKILPFEKGICAIGTAFLKLNDNSAGKPNLLAAEQALEVYGLCEIKIAKLKRAKEAYQEFANILARQIDRSNDGLLLESLGSYSKGKLRSLYAIFQPYLASAQIGNGMGLDQKIIESISKEKTENPVLVGTVLKEVAALSDGLTSELENLEDDCRFIKNYHLLLQAFATESKPLAKPASLPRAHHVIKHQKFSQTLTEVKVTCERFLRFFNPAILARLKPAQTGIPYPELESLDEALKESHQTLKLKRLFNCLYHLEQASINLESLNEKSGQFKYMVAVIHAGYELYQAWELIKALAKDPAFALIGHEILHKLQHVYTLGLSVTKPYLPQKDALLPETSIGVGANYFINILMILPEHIIHAQKKEDLSSELLEKLQASSLASAKEIERIINSSDSLFKLFFKISPMYNLFNKLKTQLTDLALTAHDSIADHLTEIRDRVLTGILLETDRWEDQLGLMPGALSNTMKRILDEFYQGLLEPLGLASQHHINLITSTVPLQNREENVNEKIKQAKQEKARIAEQREIVKSVLNNIQMYDSAAIRSNVKIFAHVQNSLHENIRRALPLFTAQSSAIVESEGLDIEGVRALLDKPINEENLEKLELLALNSLNCLAGADASQDVVIETAAEKKDYFAELAQDQEKLNNQFITDYKKDFFKKQLEIYAGKQFGLIHCGGEYQEKLKAYLYSQEDALLATIPDSGDIKDAVMKLLQNSIRHFEHRNYQHYHRLDSIRAAIANFQLYIFQINKELDESTAPEKRTLFESEKTLRVKLAHINKLQEMAENKNLSIVERIQQIRQHVKGEQFSRDMLKYHEHHNETWMWLKQCILYLFELLGLYTPPYKKHYQHLVEVTEKEQSINNLSARFGLFSTDLRGYNLPTLVEEPTPQPNVLSTLSMQ
ncbi:hypothetical protein [Legionella septentrionalis]|uniref:hypothetical protein n=1 Tax=Legionella septentrionalis TaxID=2498109 RepID=UPI000F8E82FC|nr:hypothetical protein [Legionella septentrionalis]RUR10233.1 hypothetical protein ELY14_06100 [Legionella septentrionalis]